MATPSAPSGSRPAPDPRAGGAPIRHEGQPSPPSMCLRTGRAYSAFSVELAIPRAALSWAQRAWLAGEHAASKLARDPALRLLGADGALVQAWIDRFTSLPEDQRNSLDGSADLPAGPWRAKPGKGRPALTPAGGLASLGLAAAFPPELELKSMPLLLWQHEGGGGGPCFLLMTFCVFCPADATPQQLAAAALAAAAEGLATEAPLYASIWTHPWTYATTTDVASLFRLKEHSRALFSGRSRAASAVAWSDSDSDADMSDSSSSSDGEAEEEEEEQGSD